MTHSEPNDLDDVTIRCADCDATWTIFDKPAPCYLQGHHHDLNGIPVVLSDRQMSGLDQHELWGKS